MLNLTFAKDYLLHRLRSKNRHGLHSPFVYKLVDQVIYNEAHKPVYDELERHRDALFIDEGPVTVAGKQNTISQVTIDMLRSPKLAQLLHRLAVFTKPDNIVELGTRLGLTTLYLQAAVPNAKIYSLDNLAQTADVSKEVIDRAEAENISIITGNYDDTLPSLISGLDKLDLVYIDGNHTRNEIVDYLAWCLPKVHESTILIFDDIYWNNETKQAWAQIKATPQVTATVDLFWLGLVFFKQGQAKEDFKIRF